MKTSNTLRATLLAGAAVLGLCAPGIGGAVTSINFVTAGPVVYPQGSGTPQVTFTLQYSSVVNATDILAAYDFFVAYNPEVLQFYSIASGDGLGTTVAAEATLFDWNYRSDHPNAAPPVLFDTATIAGYNVGIPESKTGYYDGSLEVLASASVGTGAGFEFADYDALYAYQKAFPGGTIDLFSITFDVVTTAIAYSSLIIIDDRNYTGRPARNCSTTSLMAARSFTRIGARRGWMWSRLPHRSY